jgi:2,5-diketo-D-gluconate reductase B
METLKIMPQIPTRKLKAGNDMPVLGLGTWRLTGADCTAAVPAALELGYKAIDTADAYGNHKEVGAAIKASGVERGELFITSKVWRQNLHKQAVLDSAKRNLEELQLDYLDLYLIHWPNRTVPMAETLEALSELKQQGLIKAIGVSNFTKKHVAEALATGTEISMNQIEFHPTLNQADLKKFCEDNGIFITAYSSLAEGHSLELPAVQRIATAKGATPAQVIIAWTIQSNMFAIPKSKNKQRLEENINALEVELTAEEIAELNNLNEDYRTCTPGFHEFDAYRG